MDSRRGFFAPRSGSNWTSWRSLFKTIPLLLGVLFFAYQASRENDAATRQQTSFGILTDCQRSGRGGNRCSYTFSADGEQYIGSSSVATDGKFGDTVEVYYDSQNPTMNALEDFSERSHKARNFVYILLLVTGAFWAFILYSIATNQQTS